MKHTPGPWIKRGNIIFGAELSLRVAKVYATHMPTLKSAIEEESANASLIAAAPEMLQFLELLASNDIDSPEVNPLSQKLLDLIAKARGES